MRRIPADLPSHNDQRQQAGVPSVKQPASTVPRRGTRAAAAACAFVLCLPVLGAPPAALAQTAPATSPSTSSAVLVELFTSEGCSSCPPADQLLRAVNGKHTADGQLIVGISEHVTYWNRLGWTDPFSAEAFTDRQNAYGQRFRLDSVYTPQMVINGREQIVGGSGGDLEAAFRSESRRGPVALQIVSAERVGDALSVHFRVGPIPGEEPAEMIAVIADDADRSHVARGENAGRSLDHVAVARTLTRVTTLRGATEATVGIPLPASVLGNAKAGHHLVLFVQSPRSGPVLAVQVQPF